MKCFEGFCAELVRSVFAHHVSSISTSSALPKLIAPQLPGSFSSRCFFDTSQVISKRDIVNDDRCSFRCDLDAGAVSVYLDTTSGSSHDFEPDAQSSRSTPTNFLDLVLPSAEKEGMAWFRL